MQSHASATPLPPQTPHASFSNVDPHALSHPVGPGSLQPQPKSTLPAQSHAPASILSLHGPHSPSHVSPLPFGTPQQSAHELSSPPQTLHSSNTKVEPHVLSHPDGPGLPHPQPLSAISSQHPAAFKPDVSVQSQASATPLPPQTPHASSTALPLHSPAQSATALPPHSPEQSTEYIQLPSSVLASIS